MFKYTFSIILLFFTLFSWSQEDNLYAPVKVKEPLVFKGIKVGLNVGRFSDFVFKPERTSYEGSVDFNLNHKYFGVIEGGVSSINLEKDNYTYLSDGYFVKAGVEFNMLKKYPADYLGIGIKLGMADFSQKATNVLLEDDHWSDFLTAVNAKSYNTYWLEASLGIKGEIFKNVYMGWAALIKLRVRGKTDSDFQPYDIPGFGNPANSIHLGVNYYIYYQIPFNRNK